jgi:hypothetical protein
MKHPVSMIFCSALALLAGAVAPVSAGGATLYLGGGATGATRTLTPFHGGWGVGATLEVPAARVADFLVRADVHVIPAVESSPFFYFPVGIANGADPFGRWPEGAARSTLLGLFTGVRLHPAEQRSGVYLDLLAGLGHARFTRDGNGISPIVWAGESDIRDDTNVALSLGSGVKLRALGRGTAFLDVHYEFYFVGDRKGAIIPIRLGYGVPV